MVAQLQIPSRTARVARPALSGRSRTLINRLRAEALTCRASARLDFFQACASIGTSNSEDRVAIILVRVLGQALDRCPRWLRPGEKSFSFDEAWLARVIEAFQNQDIDSYTFLTQSRISEEKRRGFKTLLANLLKSSNLE